MFDIYFMIIGFSWMIFEIIVANICYASDDDGKTQDSNSLKWVNFIIYSSLIIALWLKNGVDTGMVFAYDGDPITWIGLTIMLAGLAIRLTAILTLKKYFTVNLAINNEHKIIKSGLYRYVRHPSYSGSIISFIGMGLALGDWLALIAAVVPVTLLFTWRIKLEENMLMQAFPSDYIEYKKSSWRFFPGLY